MQRLNRNPQATKVVRELMRYIHRTGMRPGDKLPSQAEIREQFGFHNTTLDTAMETLVSHGIVNRRKKSGTVLVDSESPLRGLWTVGLALLSARSPEPFYGQLLHLIQTHLHAAKVSMRQYMLDPQIEGSSDIRISKFSHLVDDLTDDALDAVLTLSYMPDADWSHWASSSPFVHVGSWENAPCGVIIEQSSMVRDALKLLAARGVRNPAIVSMGDVVVSPQARFWKEFVKTADELGLYHGEHQHLFARGKGATALAGRIVAERVLALPPDERPDGFIIINDIIANGFCVVLAGQPDYNPPLVVQTNKQAPLAFARPVIQFQLDIDELARQAVDMLVARLFEPALPAERKWVAPRFSGEGQFGGHT